MIKQACDTQISESAARLTQDDNIFVALSSGKDKMVMLTDIVPVIDKIS